MKDCAGSESSATDERAPGPASAPRLAQQLAHSRIQDLSSLQEKLVEMEEYTRKLVAVQGEVKDLLDQENDNAFELLSMLVNDSCNGLATCPLLRLTR
ncbi:hypothetical protein F442_02885 [Phytophthora nicotianae P10297]|uniref:Uncharacterized protein n=1 Tax=Phytophthora nicotianae P10297 TaxID=1317064 RepID=W2ZXN6_PHYNI|nr:hypothetical protein F442_02885 [Phytophthora nicotianae P10297]